MGAVLLVVLPFGSFEAPQIGISIIQAQLKSQGIPCDIAYLNIPFAEAVGREAYSTVTLTAGELFGGEWLFSGSVAFARHPDRQGYVEEVLLRSTLPDYLPRTILAMAPFIEPYLEYCLRAVPWERYEIVGFTSMFEQNLASLALAQRLKQRYPKLQIVMGGSNCAAEMGVQLHRSFPFVDVVFTGESDLTFPEFVACSGRLDAAALRVPGLVHRDGTHSIESAAAPVRYDLDALPYPNYDDFFRQIRASRLYPLADEHMLFESSRGCWWGQKHQCRFCGLNSNGIQYRAKSAERTLDEILYLVARHGVRQLMAVDNIIHFEYLATLIPELKRRQLPISLFYETKANLKKEQVKLLREAGVTLIQPGIEAFSRNVLRLFNKGVTPLQNVQLLKWCKQYGMEAAWNVLFGFPGENLQDYRGTREYIAALRHLPAPMAYGRVRLDRFSPIFEAPARYGIRNVRPMKAYSYIYPLEEDALHNLAYFFEFDYDGKEKIERWSQPLVQELEDWRQQPPGTARLQVTRAAKDHIVVHDTRPTRVREVYRFAGLEKSIIEFCDEIRRFPEVLDFVRQASNGSPTPEGWLRGFLDYLVAHRLMLRDGDRCLSVISPAPQHSALAFRPHLQQLQPST